MSAVDTKFYEKKKSTIFYISFSLLLIVVILTIGLYFYTQTLEKKTEEINTKISSIDSSIRDLQGDDKIQIYSNYIEHEALIVSLANKSQIPLFISHLKKNFLKYSLDANNFVYSDGNVTTELSFQTDDAGYAYEKVIKFLREYEQEEKALFTVENVTSFTGYDRITYKAELQLK